MVSQYARTRAAKRRVRSDSSRARILSAATEEFAARGFDGAKVDRIARRAGLNKAMLYYHFASKTAVYREILRSVFRDVAGAVARVREAGGPPETQLRAYVRAVADHAVARPHFPPLWLRELSDGGRRLDGTVLAEMGGVLATLAAILHDGRKAGRFVEVDPFITQAAIAAPLLLLAATRGLRARFQGVMPVPTSPSHESAVAHIQAATLAAVTRATPAARARRPRASRSLARRSS